MFVVYAAYMLIQKFRQGCGFTPVAQEDMEAENGA